MRHGGETGLPLWIATERGLFRFDGRTFHRYATEDMEGIEDQRIQHVIADNEGVIWIRTRSLIRGCGRLR